jgi:hypothetical protein
MKQQLAKVNSYDEMFYLAMSAPWSIELHQPDVLRLQNEFPEIRICQFDDVIGRVFPSAGSSHHSILGVIYAENSVH